MTSDAGHGASAWLARSLAVQCTLYLFQLLLQGYAACVHLGLACMPSFLWSHFNVWLGLWDMAREMTGIAVYTGVM